MKKKLLLMLLAIGLAAGVAEANMLLNPSFEDGSFVSGTPDYWAHFYISSEAQHVWVDSAAGAHSGDRFMEMYNWLPTTASSGWLGQEVLGVEEGYEYLFEVWAKTATAGVTKYVGIYVDWYSTSSALTSSAAGWLGWDTAAATVTGDVWTEVAFDTLISPEGAIAAVLWLAAPIGNSIDAIYYDDVSMLSLGLAPEPNFVVDAGIDMITWSGESIQLDPNVVNNGPEVLTYHWSADPDDSNASFSDPCDLAPIVTIIKATGEVVTFELTLEVSDGSASLSDTMRIDVYDNECLAARNGVGLWMDNPTDIDGNCRTGLEDLAALASTWLKFAEGVTEPFPRP